jgi:two-component system cell cycle sensor histidine kinase/response regulator CckA
MAFKLQDLIDIEQFQMLQDRLNEIYSFPSAIIDNEGRVLTATAWQDVCTKFHRQNSECEKECLKSDQYIADHLHEANPAVSYRCPQGLIDNATPIIIDGIHYGNYFTGQFFLEPPDLNFFKEQAKRYGFDEEAYIEAVKKVPIWTQEQLNSYLFFIKGLIEVIASTGLKNLKEIEARTKLEESEERASTILNQMQDGFWVTNTQGGQIIDANEAMCSMLGYTRNELLRMSVADVEANDSQEVIEGTIREVIQVGTTNFESRFRRKDGTIINMDVSITYLPQRDLLFCFHRDITAHRLAENALRESEENYRSLFQNASIGIFHSLPKGQFLRVNPALAQMMGYMSPEEMISSITDINTQIYIDSKKRSDLLASLQDKTGWIYAENRYRRKDGTIMTANLGVRQVLNANGKIAYLEGFVEDITKAKQTEEALGETESRFRAFVEQAPVAIGVWNLDGTGLYANRKFIETLGLQSVEEMVGRPAFDFFVPQFREDSKERTRRRLQGLPVPTEYESILLRTDGAEFPVRVAVAPIQLSGKTVSISFLTDLTENKRAEEEKRKLEERLQHADKMEAIGTLAGGIAHDFNNLLMGIQGYASLTLLDLDPSHPHYERLKRIEEQVQNGADLSKQLLGFARGGRYEVKPSDMNDILEKSSSMFGRTKKEITIHRKFGKDLRPVEVDRGQMEQVFMNLYVNAWQAMPGGGEIYLETENAILDDEQAAPYAIKPGKYVKIAVTDTGTGMDEKTKARIFDPFFTTKGMGRGTGLGLATVYGIIKGHKGMIHVDSEPGHGTTFTIYLPASEKEIVREENAARIIVKGTETILLVDDEKIVLEASKAMLESMGYRIYAVGSGQEAIAVYMEKGNDIALVILDMIMPGISGGETFDRLRDITPGIKVLLSSGYSVEGQAREILDRGCNGFIQKPFRLEMLSQKVREMID